LNSGRISFGALGCVTLFSGTCRKEAYRPVAPKSQRSSQCARIRLAFKKPLSAIPHRPLNSERLDLVPKSHCAGTAKVRGVLSGRFC
jgi:hypothetical protein